MEWTWHWAHARCWWKPRLMTRSFQHLREAPAVLAHWYLSISWNCILICKKILGSHRAVLVCTSGNVCNFPQWEGNKWQGLWIGWSEEWRTKNNQTYAFIGTLHVCLDWEEQWRGKSGPGMFVVALHRPHQHQFILGWWPSPMVWSSWLTPSWNTTWLAYHHANSIPEWSTGWGWEDQESGCT